MATNPYLKERTWHYTTADPNRKRPEAPPEPKRLTRSAVLKRLRWSDADLDVAQQSLGFPKAVGQKTTIGSFRAELLYREDQIDKWLSDVRERRDQIDRLLRAAK